MNVFDLLLKALVNYVEKHPEVIDQLVERLVKLLLAELEKLDTAKQ